ncbi:MAG TPA: HNH endonuclease [Saprospiraceae bacterium]|nr:HNH endonuclease [Saprospiraceae bacterium]HPN70205.1 HNH endonuclease [Saprospiraceae bacterium]
MKKCIWCLKNEENTTFNNLAHTIPKSLGGNYICINVCDFCNNHFGNRDGEFLNVEETFKEMFNITRQSMRFVLNKLKSNNNRGRYKSKYFHFPNESCFKLKASYRNNFYFQKRLLYALKRGIYKVFLEEFERQYGDSANERFDFVRRMARYKLGDYPLYYFQRKHGIIMMIENEVDCPYVVFDKYNYYYNSETYFEFEFLGHLFGFPINEHYEIGIDIHLMKSLKMKEEFFTGYKIVKKVSDVDFLLTIMNK